MAKVGVKVRVGFQKLFNEIALVVLELKYRMVRQIRNYFKKTELLTWKTIYISVKIRMILPVSLTIDHDFSFNTFSWLKQLNPDRITADND